MSELSKSSHAFRTISEVSDDLGVPQHVLRFWETKFSSIRPMKRGGNRRYYRPEDIQLLRAINKLLYVDGYTIRGVQKLIRENGIREIAALHGGDMPSEVDGSTETNHAIADVSDVATAATVNDFIDLEVVNQSRMDFEPDPSIDKTPLFMTLPSTEPSVETPVLKPAEPETKEIPKTDFSDAISRLQRTRANIQNALAQAG
jgi:DNA-binding transcriptional MerR regulator